MTKVWNTVIEWAKALHPTQLGEIVGLTPETTEKFLWTIAVVAIYLVIRRALTAIIAKRVSDVTRQYVLGKTINYVLGFLSLIAFLKIWLGGVGGIATYFGIYRPAWRSP